jgi:hypothetical protein
MNALGGHSATYTLVVWLVACGIGLSVLAAMSLAYRWAKRERELEDAERVLAEALAEDDRSR